MLPMFIHIPKTGGMSVRYGARDRIIVADPRNLVSDDYAERLRVRMSDAGEHHGYQHARWRDWREDLREKHPAFAIVRNPWARVVSRYTFAQITGDRDGRLTFRQFLESSNQYAGLDLYWHRAIRGWYPQTDYVVDNLGRIRCDCLRFGSDDVHEYLGLPGPLPIRNQSNISNLDYRIYYRQPREVEIVAEIYAKDIDTFGFTFDNGATRNLWMHGSSR